MHTLIAPSPPSSVTLNARFTCLRPQARLWAWQVTALDLKPDHLDSILGC